MICPTHVGQRHSLADIVSTGFPNRRQDLVSNPSLEGFGLGLVGAEDDRI